MDVHLNLACGMIRKLRQQMTPRFIWKFDHFAQCRDLAKNGGQKFYISPSFSAGPQGYQMKMHVYPNGDGQGENTHLSFFVDIIQGKYDAILTWPFKLNVSFTLIDQQADQTKRKNIQCQLVPVGNAWGSQDSFTRPLFLQVETDLLNAGV